MGAEEEIAALARSAAASQRLGMGAQGAELVARLVDVLTPWLARRPERARSLAPLVAAIVAAQTRGDAIGLADLLEHELCAEIVRP